MASISANATLILATYTDIKIDSAKIQYKCIAEIVNKEEGEKIENLEGNIGDITITEYSYSDLYYQWNFSSSNASGTVTFSNLKPGQKNDIKTSVTVSCIEQMTETIEVYDTEKGEDGEDTGLKDSENKPIFKHTAINEYKTTIKEEIENSIIVYTHPGTFTDYNFTSDIIICSSNGLTAEKVDNWCKHCGAYLSWKNQSDKYNAAEECKVNSGNIITANWFNSCYEVLGLEGPVESGKTIITAEIFKQLGAQISML